MLKNYCMNRMFLLFLFIAFISCDPKTDPVDPTPTVTPDLSISDSNVFENTGGTTMQFEVGVNTASELPISFNFKVEGITAEPDKDFVAGTGSTILGAGAFSVVIEVTIKDDDIHEVDEKIQVTLTEASNATIKDAVGIGVIRDNDDPSTYDDDGYYTLDNYFGYELAWSDEFSGDALNLEDYNFDLNDGCPNLCGWGNNELQWYTDLPANIKVEDGKLSITATKEGPTSFKSAKFHTKDKQSFQYGRIDVRAKLPKGQGIWPAIWMLGTNIDDVGWPACGEIDIMELVGHQANVSHGTAHWGADGSTQSTFKGSSFSLSGEDFSDKFHVFTLLWEEDEMVWYVDETPFHIITPADMQGLPYRFNHEFYMLFNVAVGGNWPGNPDDTTVFPQTMEVDYVRYFK